MRWSLNDMRSHVVKLVRQTVEEHASTEIPIFEEIQEGLGLVLKEGRLPRDVDGMIEGNTIVLNSEIRNRERREFTQFHEVMHYLMNADEDLISELDAVTSTENGEYKRKLEQFCNIGAAEFLMPREQFRALFNKSGFSVNVIPLASSHFGASSIATTIQLAQIAPNSCISAICEFGTPPNDMSPTQGDLLYAKNVTNKPTLHVAYSASSPNTKYPLAKNTRIPEDHLIHQAFSNSGPIEEKSYVPFRSGKKMPCYCEALQDKDRNRVFVIFHLTLPPSPDQLTLI